MSSVIQLLLPASMRVVLNLTQPCCSASPYGLRQNSKNHPNIGLVSFSPPPIQIDWQPEPSRLQFVQNLVTSTKLFSHYYPPEARTSVYSCSENWDAPTRTIVAIFACNEVGRSAGVARTRFSSTWRMAFPRWGSSMAQE